MLVALAARAIATEHVCMYVFLNGHKKQITRKSEANNIYIGITYRETRTLLRAGIGFRSARVSPQ